MSDLISRSELLKRLEEWNTSDEMDKALYNFAFNRIIEQPTGYELDSVVEKLEEAKHTICLSDDDLEHYQNGIDRAIEIVNQGCASDDVCEWRCDVYGRWHTKCHTLADNDPLEYKYCPYCGKKIKVV